MSQIDLKEGQEYRSLTGQPLERVFCTVRDYAGHPEEGDYTVKSGR